MTTTQEKVESTNNQTVEQISRVFHSLNPIDDIVLKTKNGLTVSGYVGAICSTRNNEGKVVCKQRSNGKIMEFINSDNAYQVEIIFGGNMGSTVYNLDELVELRKI